MAKKYHTADIPSKQTGHLHNYEEKRKKVSCFNLTSDIFFGKVMEDKSACEEVLRILTGRYLKVREVRSQYSIRHLETHSVTLDVLAESQTGKIINLEMQTSENENHLKRSRYHQSCIDVSMLEKGNDFDALPDLYIIFITRIDFLKLGRGIYHIDRTIRENGTSIPSGVNEIYVNLQGKVKNHVLRSLLDYIKNTDTAYENNNFPHLINRVKFYKEKREGIDIMCDIIDAFVKEGKEAGMALGKAQGMKEGLEQGRAIGLEQGQAIGLKQGQAIGLEQGQAKINSLIQLLASQNRISDIIKSAEDPVYQKKLLQEFQL